MIIIHKPEEIQNFAGEQSVTKQHFRHERHKPVPAVDVSKLLTD